MSTIRRVRGSSLRRQSTDRRPTSSCRTRYQMNVAVQREILPSLSMSVAYVGTRGHKYPLSPDINYPVFTSTATAANVDSRRPILPGVSRAST